MSITRSHKEEWRLARVAVGVLAAGALAAAVLLSSGGAPPRDPWLERFQGVAPPDEAQLEATVDWLAGRLVAGDGAPPPQVADRAPRLIFVSLSDGEGPAEVVIAEGDGLADAAERALALAEARGGDKRWRGIKVDALERLGEAFEVGDREELDFERGLDGLVFDGAPGVAVLPEEVVVRTLVNSDRELRASNIDKYLGDHDPERAEAARGIWRGGRAVVRTFTTRSWFADSGRRMRLYRGHRELRRVQVGELLDAAESAGDYLRRAVDGDGRFVYSYLAKTDRAKDDYNMLRHAGTTYSMLELVEVTDDEELLDAAERALGFLRRQVVECADPSGTWGACVAEKGYVKLGGNALAILAFAQHAAVTGDRSALPLLERLASWMTGIQSDSGEFTIHKQHLQSGEVDDHVSAYYPGEALFALARLYQLDGNPTWLDAAERGAEWLIQVRDAGLGDGELSHDHWLLYALEELDRIRPRALFGEHALRLARIIAAAQNVEPEFPDWRGSYYRPPRSTPTATRSEGLGAAWRLASRAGREREAAGALEAMRLGIDFQLQVQFRPESALYLPDPQRVLGGFPRSLTDFEIRIDYVQHSLSSLLALREILGGAV